MDWGTVLATLIGAVVGAAAAMVGSLLLQVRIERRRQIAGARLILTQLRRSGVELDLLGEREDETWIEGPHQGIRTDAWQTHAADLIGRLRPRDFETIDRTHHELTQASEWGMTLNETRRLRDEVDAAERILEPLAGPTWFDHHVWRL